MATRLIPAFAQFFDANGDPLTGGKIYTYESGTTTPKVTFADAALTVANSNPVMLNAAGRAPDVFADVGDYKVVLTDATGVMIETRDPVDGAPVGSAGQGLSSFKNLLINGQFLVKQRSATSIANDTYGFDCWYHLNQTGAVTVSQLVDAESGQPTSLRITQAQSTPQRFGIAQIIETDNCRHLRGSFVSLSFRARSSLAQPVRYAILSWDGAPNVVTSDVVSDWTSATYAAGDFFIGSDLSVIAVGSFTPSAGTWTQAPSLSGVVPSSMGNLIAMVWTEDAAAENATLDLGLAQLEPGEEASAYEYRPNMNEVSYCFRYFYRADNNWLQGYGLAGSTAQTTMSLLNTMFKTPTISFTATQQANCSGSTVVARGQDRVGMATTVTATGNFIFQFNFTADASL